MPTSSPIHHPTSHRTPRAPLRRATDPHAAAQPVADRPGRERLSSRLGEPVRFGADTLADRVSGGGQAPALEDALIEIFPERPGCGPTAAGFALALAAARRQQDSRLRLWIEAGCEDGRLASEGVAQFGLTPRDLILVSPRSQRDALWAAEQALRVKSTIVILSATASAPLTLTATRRLLLAAEEGGGACVLLRHDAEAPSAAILRWRVAPGRSDGADRELGPPVFEARLTRNRRGPAGGAWRVTWKEAALDLKPIYDPVDGRMAADAAGRPAEAMRHAV